MLFLFGAAALELFVYLSIKVIGIKNKESMRSPRNNKLEAQEVDTCYEVL